jgi:integrase
MRQRSANKRKKKPQILSPDEFQKLHDELHEPYRTRVIVAMCTGMRVSEVLALRWDHINFKAGVMLVQQGVVNGRIGFVKTGASNDYIPLDPAFAQISSIGKGTGRMGLPSLPPSLVAATTRA